MFAENCNRVNENNLRHVKCIYIFTGINKLKCSLPASLFDAERVSSTRKIFDLVKTNIETRIDER